MTDLGVDLVACGTMLQAGTARLHSGYEAGTVLNVLPALFYY